MSVVYACSFSPMAYNFYMNTNEHEPTPAKDMVEVVRYLSEGEGVLLGRNTLQVIDADNQLRALNIHYEGLNEPTPTRGPLNGKPVMYEFYKTAAPLSREAHFLQYGPAYPVLSVINNLTGEAASTVVDVAKLITDEVLPIYARQARTKGGGDEMLSVDLSVVAGSLIEEIGYTPEDVVVFDGRSIIECDDALPETRAFIRKNHTIGAEVDSFQIDPRGDTALSIVQMDVAQSFLHHVGRDPELAIGNVEVALRVGPRPDMQTIMLSLIDCVESCGGRLYLTKSEIATQQEGYEFAILDKDLEVVVSLSGDFSLMTATYDAYNRVRELFPGLQH